MIELSLFTRAYVECALWSSTDDDGEPMDAIYSVDDIADSSLVQMAGECADFQTYAAPLLAVCPGDDEQNGHDFWLTRNGHGAGFWDRGYGKLGDQLSDAAKTFGSSDLYIGDNGMIYVS